MSEEEKNNDNLAKDSENLSDGYKPLNEGYVPLKKGYTPTQGSLNPNDPPKGGSGVSKEKTPEPPKEEK